MLNNKHYEYDEPKNKSFNHKYIMYVYVANIHKSHILLLKSTTNNPKSQQCPTTVCTTYPYKHVNDTSEAHPQSNWVEHTSYTLVSAAGCRLLTAT